MLNKPAKNREVHWPRPPGQAGPKLNPIHVGMNGIEAANSGTTTLRFLTINGDHYFDHDDHYFDDRKPG